MFPWSAKSFESISSRRRHFWNITGRLRCGGTIRGGVCLQARLNHFLRQCYPMTHYHDLTAQHDWRQHGKDGRQCQRWGSQVDRLKVLEKSRKNEGRFEWSWGISRHQVMWLCWLRLNGCDDLWINLSDAEIGSKIVHLIHVVTQCVSDPHDYRI